MDFFIMSMFMMNLMIVIYVEILKYVTTNRDEYREYKSNPCECSKCPYLNKCTNSKNHQKVITHHI